MCGPRSLRIRMWMGVCPPSKFTFCRAPEREPAPLWPRPDVLPVPEPSPRPMRLRGRRDPGAGFSEWSPMRSSAIDLHQMIDCVDETANGGVILTLHRTSDLSETKGLQGLILLPAGAGEGLDLCDGQLAHAGASSAAGS